MAGGVKVQHKEHVALSSLELNGIAHRRCRVRSLALSDRDVCPGKLLYTTRRGVQVSSVQYMARLIESSSGTKWGLALEVKRGFGIEALQGGTLATG